MIKRTIIKKMGVFAAGLAVFLGTVSTGVSLTANAAANPNPTWTVGSRCFYPGAAGSWDAVSVKDPSIVNYNGKYYLFYTGYDTTGKFQMGCASASTIQGLVSAPHKKLNLNGSGTGSYGAPQVFYFEAKKTWYLIYQGSLGACYATTTNIDDPNSWSGPKSMGANGNMGWDYWVICDDQYAYLFNTPSDGSHNIYCRKTSLANFPNGWGSPTIAVRDTFEGAEVYKSKADNMYYMLVEDMKDNRYYELHQASSLNGPWTKVSEKWASTHNLSYTADKWTNRVSHGELIRSGINQKLEINDINKADFLIQGSMDGNVAYEKIKWYLGVIKNYSGGQTPTTPTTPTTGGTVVECENMNLGGSYAGKITSPFNGVALYANNDSCAYTQYFGYSNHSFSLKGCSNNSSTAKVDLQIGGKTVGTFNFTGTTPTVQTISNVTHGTGNQEIKLVVTSDNGTWDAYIDNLQYVNS